MEIRGLGLIFFLPFTIIFNIILDFSFLLYRKTYIDLVINYTLVNSINICVHIFYDVWLSWALSTLNTLPRPQPHPTCLNPNSTPKNGRSKKNGVHSAHLMMDNGTTSQAKSENKGKKVKNPFRVSEGQIHKKVEMTFLQANWPFQEGLPEE